MENNADTFFHPAREQEPNRELGEINSSDGFHKLRDQVAIVTLIDPIDHYQHQLVRFSTKSRDGFNNEFLELMDRCKRFGSLRSAFSMAFLVSGMEILS